MSNNDNKTQTASTYLDKMWKSGEKHRNDAWYRQHLTALHTPREGFEGALVAMLQGWLLYADTVASTYGSGIGGDYVLGPQWAAIGHGLRGLLNGETGRLDCGLVDGILGDTLQAEGYPEE